MSNTRTPDAELGYQDYLAGKDFNECPFKGFGPQAIDRRHDWQLGWWRAEKEQPRKKP